MVNLCHDRLRRDLYSISNFRRQDKSLHEFTGVFVDAWSIVDATSRLRSLLSTLNPGEENLMFDQYGQATEHIKIIRDIAHHLPERVDRAVKKKLTGWGALTWITLEPIDPMCLRIHMISAGALSPETNVPVSNPCGVEMRRDLDHVVLRSFEGDVEISQAVSLVANVVGHLENALEPQFKNKESGPGDVYTSVDIVPKIIEKDAEG